MENENFKLSGKKILQGIDFTKIDDCYVECKDGTFHLVVKHNSGTTQYFLGFETKLFHFKDGAVAEILEDDFATDGAGYKEAYMAMYLGKSVEEAINLTIEMNVWASGKAQIVEIEKNQGLKGILLPPPPPVPEPDQSKCL